MVARPWETRSGRLTIWVALGLLTALSFGIDCHNVSQGGSIDLRNRVTGSRLLLAHLDPYFYKWHEPEPPEYCDPYNNPQLPVSKTTATPAMLVLGAPVAMLPYRTAQYVWLVVQWACLLGATALWLPLLPPSKSRLVFAAFVIGFTYTAAWRLHAERGQAYIFLLLLVALWCVGSLQEKWTFFSGFIAGVLTALRPPFLLLGTIVAMRRRGQIPGFITGVLVALLLPMLWRGDIWLKYAAAMQTHSALYRGGIDPAPGLQSFPATIEGMPTDLLGNYAAIPYADFSLHALLRSFNLEPAPSFPFLVVVGAAALSWLWWRRGSSSEGLLAGLLAWLFLFDLALPAYRNIYNDVLVLNLAALAFFLPRTRWPQRFFFIALPIGWAIDYFAPMHDWMIDLPSACYTAGAVGLLF